MNSSWNLQKIIFLCGLLLFIPLNVDAKATSKNEICIQTDSGSNFYIIDKKGEEVVPFYVTYEDIVGTDKYPKGCYCSKVGDKCLDNTKKTPTCATDYKFTVESQNLSCKVNNRNSEDEKYEFYICPGDNSYNVVNDMQKGMSIDYISSSSNYKVTFSIPENFKGKVSAKLIRKITKNGVELFDIDTENGLPNSSSSVKKIYSTNDINNGVYFKPGSEYYFIFYLSDSNDGCNGERLGYIMGAVPSTVPNPMYNNSICTDFRSKYASGSVERIMVSECDTTDIQHTDLDTIRDTIKEKITEVEKIQKNIESSVAPTNSYTCLFENNSNTVNTQIGFSTKSGFLDIAGTGTYWKAFCTETISLEYDDPIAVEAGSGFGYNAKAIVNRTCIPIKISEPKYLPTCNYSVECWGGPANHNGEAGAGPTEDFDNCINTCDGGKYTQDCINSCYEKVYGNSTISYKDDNKLINTTFLAIGKINYELTRLSSNNVNWGDRTLIGTTNGGQTNLPISSGCVIAGNNIDNGCNTKCWDGTTCQTQHGVTFTYLNGCNSNGETEGTKCYEVYTNWPCEDGKGYENDILASEAEYNEIVNAIQKFNEISTNNEKYEIVIDEAYGELQTDGTYKTKKTVFNNIPGDNYTIESDITTGKVITTYQETTRIADPSVGDLTDTFIKEHINKEINEYEISRTISLNIGSAYLSRTNGNDIVYNNKVTPTDPDLDKNAKYYPAKNVYFTSINTPEVNKYLNWPYYNNAVNSDSTDNYTKNIHVRFYNVGSWNQWGTESTGVSVDCLYGTVSGIICDPKVEDCDGDIQYIFRTIDIESDGEDNMFPNRDPRFNWTGTITADGKATGAALKAPDSLYQFAVDPEALIKNIETKGESIYTDNNEIDYEFILTKENIRNIRKYNKNIIDYNGDGEKNYLDYNMSCFTKKINGKDVEVCTSRFLDNINGNSGSESSADFITYSSIYNIDRRKAIAGCNNAKNGTCVSASE